MFEFFFFFLGAWSGTQGWILLLFGTWLLSVPDLLFSFLFIVNIVPAWTRDGYDFHPISGIYLK